MYAPFLLVFFALSPNHLLKSSTALSGTDTGASYSLSPYPRSKVVLDDDNDDNDYQKIAAEDPSVILIQNPFASGISKEDVDMLVNEVMKDPDINIGMIPDVLEKQIYRSTITIVLNAVYRLLASQHGRNLPAGHCLRLGRRQNSISKERIHNYYLASIRDDNFDYEMLKNVADRMLANPAINQRFLPDVIEKQLYLSCLKLIFRLLGMIAASTRISLCGHEIRLYITKSAASAVAASAVQSAQSTMTTIDIEHIEEFAREAGLKKYELNQSKKRWRFFGRRKQEFLIHLHASLYGLILGIVDDLLYNTKLELLSDRVRLDVVPTDDEEMMTYRNTFGIGKPPKAVPLEDLQVEASKTAVDSMNKAAAVNGDAKDGADDDTTSKQVAEKEPQTDSVFVEGGIRPLLLSFAVGLGAGLSIMAAIQGGGPGDDLFSVIADRGKDIMSIFDQSEGGAATSLKS